MRLLNLDRCKKYRSIPYGLMSIIDTHTQYMPPICPNHKRDEEEKNGITLTLLIESLKFIWFV